MRIAFSVTVGLLFIGLSLTAAANEQTRVFWGDTHLHSNYSFDAYLAGNQTADPDMASEL
jgi:hypothetical protein